MKREDIKQILNEIAPEQLNAIMDLNGADLEKEKAKQSSLEKELSGAKESLEKVTSELETLKSATGEEMNWKAKYEALKAETEAKEKQAETERLLKEKNESIEKRFNECVGEKEFNHDAIRALYLKKFGDALENENFAGKSDDEIFKELTDDDENAFKGVTIVKLAGGTVRPTDAPYSSKDDIMAIKNRRERRQAIAENPSLFGLFRKGDR